MNTSFRQYINKLPILMEQLKKSDLIPTSNLQTVPSKGIYVFYENRKPIYVGRSNNIKARIQYHCRPSSGHGSATFAFILAKEAAKNAGLRIDAERAELEIDNEFKNQFDMAKARVSTMSIRVVNIESQILQTLFEVYAAVELDTKYNDFSTH